MLINFLIKTLPVLNCLSDDLSEEFGLFGFENTIVEKLVQSFYTWDKPIKNYNIHKKKLII